MAAAAAAPQYGLPIPAPAYGPAPILAPAPAYGPAPIIAPAPAYGPAPIPAYGPAPVYPDVPPGNELQGYLSQQNDLCLQ